MKPIRTHQKIIDLIKQFEGFRSEVYRCPAGKLSIGYGHTGMNVKLGMRITLEEAEALLRKDLVKIESAIAPMITPKLGENAFSALASFAYNVGY